MFANKLKELRTQHGLTQAQLAKKLNIGTSTIGMYESNIRKPSFEVLIKIAIFFNVSTDYLINDDEDNSDLKNIEYLFKSLTPSEKQQVKDFIEFIKKKK